MAEYSIGQLSQMFQLPTSTLRYYEDVGLLTKIGRNESGQRIYGDMHVNRLKTLCCFKNTGMSIAQLQQYFSYEEKEVEQVEDILQLLTHQQQFLDAQMEQLKKDQEHLGRKLRYFQDMKDCRDQGKPLPNWQDYKKK